MQQHNVLPPSQSLWVRDRFLIEMHDAFSVWQESQSLWVRDRFLINKKAVILDGIESQSLWVRDRFLIFPKDNFDDINGRNPFGSGTGF